MKARHWYLPLVSAREGLKLGVAVAGVAGILYGLNILAQDQPDLSVSGRAVEVFAVEALGGSCPTELAVESTEGQEAEGGSSAAILLAACRHNRRVADRDGASTTRVDQGDDLVMLVDRIEPPPGGEFDPSSLTDGLAGIVRRVPESGHAAGGADELESLVTGGWGLSGPDGAFEEWGSPDRWPSELGCGPWLVELERRYGPVGCLEGPTTIVALAGSPGVPGFAQQLVAAGLTDPADLAAALGQLSGLFQYRVALTVTNEGTGAATDTEVVVPPGFVRYAGQPRDGVRPCDSGGTEGAPFLLKSYDACVMHYETAASSRQELGALALAFGAEASNKRSNWPIWVIGALALVSAALLAVAYYARNPDDL